MNLSESEWQHDDKRRSYPFGSFYSQLAAMPFCNDVIRHGKAQSGTLTSGFCREEGLKYLVNHISRYPVTIISNLDTDPILLSYSFDNNGRSIGVADR